MDVCGINRVQGGGRVEFCGIIGRVVWEGKYNRDYDQFVLLYACNVLIQLDLSYFANGSGAWLSQWIFAPGEDSGCSAFVGGTPAIGAE